MKFDNDSLKNYKNNFRLKNKMKFIKKGSLKPASLINILSPTKKKLKKNIYSLTTFRSLNKVLPEHPSLFNLINKVKNRVSYSQLENFYSKIYRMRSKVFKFYGSAKRHFILSRKYIGAHLKSKLEDLGLNFRFNFFFKYEFSNKILKLYQATYLHYKKKLFRRLRGLQTYILHYVLFLFIFRNLSFFLNYLIKLFENKKYKLFAFSVLKNRADSFSHKISDGFFLFVRLKIDRSIEKTFWP